MFTKIHLKFVKIELFKRNFKGFKIMKKIDIVTIIYCILALIACAAKVYLY